MVVGKGIGEKQCFGTGIYAHIWVYIFAVIEYLNDIFLYVLVFCRLESKESWLQMSSLTALLPNESNDFYDVLILYRSVTKYAVGGTCLLNSVLLYISQAHEDFCEREI